MKPVTHRDPLYLSFIRSQACAGFCAQPQHMGNGPNHYSIEAAHVRIGNAGGIALKPSDYRAVPLCHMCHDTQHRHGELSFWNGLGKNPDVVCAGLLAEWLGQNGRGKDALIALEELCAGI